MSQDDSRIPVLVCSLLTLGTLTLTHSAAFLTPTLIVLFYGSLFLPYFVLLFWLRHRRMSDAAEPKTLLLVTLLITAAATRLVAIGAEPILSDDIYRYIWDGRVCMQGGINPFAYPPSAPELTHLRDQAIWPLINHKDVPTIYPPLAQILFGLHSFVDLGTYSMRALLVLIEGIGVLGIGWIFKRRHHKGVWLSWDMVCAASIYLLNPLIVMEVAWSGHVDVLAWMPLTAALLWWSNWRERLKDVLLVGALLGLSITAKFLGLLVLPLMMCAPAKRACTTHVAWSALYAKRTLLCIVVASVVVASYAPFAHVGSNKLFAGFGTYASKWRSNDALFRVHATTLQALLEHDTPPHTKVIFHFEKLNTLYTSLGWTKVWKGKEIAATSYTSKELALAIAKLIGAAIMGLVLLWGLIVIRAPMNASVLLFGTLFFIAPTVHPWYIAWLVPLSITQPRRSVLLFSFTAVGAYSAWVVFTTGGTWRVPAWIVALEYGSVAIVALLETHWGLSEQSRLHDQRAATDNV